MRVCLCVCECQRSCWIFSSIPPSHTLFFETEFLCRTLLILGPADWDGLANELVSAVPVIPESRSRGRWGFEPKSSRSQSSHFTDQAQVISPALLSLVSCLTWLTVLGIKCCLPLNVTSRSLRKHSCCFHLSFPFLSHFPLSSEFLPCFLLFKFLYFPASCTDFSFSFCCLEVLSSLKHLHSEHLLYILLVSLVFCVAGCFPSA